MFKLPGLFKPGKSGLNIACQGNRNVQPMMAGHYPSNIILPHPFDRAIKEQRIGGRVKCIKASFIDQITGKQVFFIRFIKAAMTG